MCIDIKVNAIINVKSFEDLLLNNQILIHTFFFKFVYKILVKN